MPMMSSDDPNEAYLTAKGRTPKGVSAEVWRGGQPSVPLAGGSSASAASAMTAGAQYHDAQGLARKGDHTLISPHPRPQPGRSLGRATLRVGGRASSGG